MSKFIKNTNKPQDDYAPNEDIGQVLGENAKDILTYDSAIIEDAKAILNRKKELAINSSNNHGGVGKSYLIDQLRKLYANKVYEGSNHYLVVDPIDCYASGTQTRRGIIEALYEGLEIESPFKVGLNETSLAPEVFKKINDKDLGKKIEEDFLSKFKDSKNDKKIILFFDSFEYFNKMENHVLDGLDGLDEKKSLGKELRTKVWLLNFLKEMRKIQPEIYVVFAGRDIKDDFNESWIQLENFNDNVARSYFESRFESEWEQISENFEAIKKYTNSFNQLWCAIFSDVIPKILGQGNTWENIENDYKALGKNIENFSFDKYLCTSFSYMDGAWGYDIHRSIIAMGVAFKGVSAEQLVGMTGISLGDAKVTISRLKDVTFIKKLNIEGTKIRLHDDFGEIMKGFLGDETLRDAIVNGANGRFESYNEELIKLINLFRDNRDERKNEQTHDFLEYITTAITEKAFADDEAKALGYFDYIEYEFFKACDNSDSMTRRIVRICKSIAHSTTHSYTKVKAKAQLLIAEYFVYILPNDEALKITLDYIDDELIPSSYRIKSLVGLYREMIGYMNPSKEKIKKLEKCYTQLLQSGQDHWATRAALVIGFCHHRLGDFEEGEKWAQQCVRDSLFLAEGIADFHDVRAHTQKVILDKSRLKALGNLSYINQRTGKIHKALNYAEQCLYEWNGQSLREWARAMINVIYCKSILHIDVSQNLETLKGLGLFLDSTIDSRRDYLVALNSYKKSGAPSNFSRYLTKENLEARLNLLTGEDIEYIGTAKTNLEKIDGEKKENRETAEALYLLAKCQICLKEYVGAITSLEDGKKICGIIHYEYLKQEIEDLFDFVKYIFNKEFNDKKYNSKAQKIKKDYGIQYDENTNNGLVNHGGAIEDEKEEPHTYIDIDIKNMLLYGNSLYNEDNKLEALDKYLLAVLCSTFFSQHRFAQTLSTLEGRNFSNLSEADLNNLPSYQKLLNDKRTKDLFADDIKSKDGEIISNEFDYLYTIITGKVDAAKLKTYNTLCAAYMSKGHQVKALVLNKAILDYYNNISEKSDDLLEKMIIRYFFHIYAHQSAGEPQFVKKFIQDAKKHLQDKNRPELDAIINVTLATSMYRTNSTAWIESYIYGDEMWGNISPNQEIIGLFKNAITELEKQEKKKYKKILAEAYFRLGEYYLLHKKERESIMYLSKCCELATDIDDKHRVLDAIESLHNALYLINGVDYYDKKTEMDSEMQNKYDKLKEYFKTLYKEYENNRDREQQGGGSKWESLKIVVAKLLMTRGDAIYTGLLKGKDFNPSDDKHRHKVSKMIYYYCFAAELFHNREVGSWNFANYVRELRKRFEMVESAGMAKVMASIFLPQWKQYTEFTDNDLRKDEGKLLLQALKARAVTLAEKTHHNTSQH